MMKKSLNTKPQIVELMVRVKKEFGGPVKFGGPDYAGSVLVPKGWKHFDCIIALDNGEKYRAGYNAFEPPKLDFIKNSFEVNRSHWQRILERS
jgi:hypothetical protein